MASAAERALEVEFRVAGAPQVAVWLEKADGTFVDTLMVTKLVGTFGLGNRPGRGDFGGGFLWPYGKREMTLPIWAHRRGVLYDVLVFQDCREGSLGWHEAQSSSEPFFCRPVTPAEMNVDVVTCPTTAFNTDKGIPLRLIDTAGGGAECRGLAGMALRTPYPPRNDIGGRVTSRDWSGAAGLADANDLDAVSQATPSPNQIHRVTYMLPATLAAGDYVVWVEVNEEGDMNDAHDYPFFVDPQLRDYGIPWLGQPSVVYQVPLAIGASAAVGQILDYGGYGSFDGSDGNVRPPDSTISTNAVGSGAGRLVKLSGPAGDYRVLARFNPEAQCATPDPVSALVFDHADYSFADLSFIPSERATSYETRYAEGVDSIKTEDDFLRAVPGPMITPSATLEKQVFRISDLRPRTAYTVAVRAFNLCRQASALSSVSVTTSEREFATVDACFIATAAYGGKDEPEVRQLRAFRDRVLARSSAGRALIDAYYEASPALAAELAERPVARFFVRRALAPVVDLTEDFTRE